MSEGEFEHLRGTVLDFRNLTNYITRSLLDAGGFRPRLHPLLRRHGGPGPGSRPRLGMRWGIPADLSLTPTRMPS